MMDFAACKWPEGLKNGEDALARRFDSLNEPTLSNLSSVLEMDEDDTGSRPPVITFSHFLPLQASYALLMLLLAAVCLMWACVMSDSMSDLFIKARGAGTIGDHYSLCDKYQSGI